MQRSTLQYFDGLIILAAGRGWNMIKGVAFDVDGTLYPQWRINTLSAPLYLRHHRLVNAYWKVRREVRNEAHAHKVADLHQYQCEMMVRNNNWDYQRTYQQVEELIYGLWHTTFERVRLFPGLLTVLDTLKKQGYKLGVMSDFPVTAKLQRLGVDGWWDAALCSEDYHALKPSPIVFEKLSMQLELPPENILYVGNHYRYDIFGGHRSGFRTAHLTLFPAKSSLADFHFYRYHKFLPQLAELQRRLGADI